MSRAERLAYLRTALAAALPSRNVTRSFVMHTMLPDADLAPGRITVISAGVADYPYETSDYNGSPTGPRQTEDATLQLIITGQIKLPEGTDPAAVEDAESDLLADLEVFADAAIADPEMVALRILRARQSQQLDAPYGWIHTEWVWPVLE
ncbi:MAG TPA: hypothetical protein VFL78_10685 [Rhodanobacteraceae bacterium]|nr:hypothetical protein [Rhodanobacteraceae bacterium]